MKISVLTPSFNKSRFVLDAIKSVVSQTYSDFDYWIIENSTDDVTKKTVYDYISSLGDARINLVNEVFTDEQRKQAYPTAVILNKYYEIMKGDYFFFLSDDDYLINNCFEKMAQHLDANPHQNVCWHSQKTMNAYSDGNVEYVSTRYANQIFNIGDRPDCQIDGGVIMFRRSLLEAIEKPYYPIDYGSAAHCDGIFMNKLCAKTSFHPIADTLSVHRITNISTFTSTKK